MPPLQTTLEKFNIGPIALHGKKSVENRFCPSNFTDIAEPLYKMARFPLTRNQTQMVFTRTSTPVASLSGAQKRRQRAVKRGTPLHNSSWIIITYIFLIPVTRFQARVVVFCRFSFEGELQAAKIIRGSSLKLEFSSHKMMQSSFVIFLKAGDSVLKEWPRS